MRAFLAPKSPDALFELQVRIARELQGSEPHGTDEEQWHRRRLRNIGDAVAWTTLTAHAVRNLSTGRTTPPSLSNQGAAFEHVIETGRSLVEDGMTVIISDVTNCISTGDLLACGDPDAPFIIECKLSLPAPTSLMQGRRGRQLSRGKAIGEYLKRNRGFVPGHQAEKVAFEIAHEPTHSWASVTAVVRAALSSGSGVESGDREVIWAARDSSFIPDEMEESFPPDSTVLIGCHSLLLCDEDLPHVSPPLTWPVEPDVAIALAELDVLLYHAIDPSLFVGHSTERARLCGVVTLAGGGDGIAAEVDGTHTQLGPRFIADVLYGFETVQSAARHMLLGLERSEEELRRLTSEGLPQETDARKPRVHFVDTLADVDAFREANEGGSLHPNDVIVFGNGLSRELGLDERPVPPGTVIFVGSPTKKGTTDK